VDVIVNLPTGYGKSFIYDILPYCSDKLNPIVVIVCPLNAIIEEVLIRHGAAAFKPTRDNLTPNVNFKFLIGHPEVLLDKNVCDWMKQWSDRVEWIIVDEAHCVSSWGCSFRPEYQHLGKLRAIFPFANVIAMTATATKKAQQDLCHFLALRVRILFKHTL
jgi:superfamily II DNA helicase RecQ